MQSTDYILISRKDLRALLDHSWISDRDQYYRLADAMNGPAATVEYATIQPINRGSVVWTDQGRAVLRPMYRHVTSWLPVPEVDHDER